MKSDEFFELKEYHDALHGKVPDYPASPYHPALTLLCAAPIVLVIGICFGAYWAWVRIKDASFSIVGRCGGIR